jgi:hypothetical protein
MHGITSIRSFRELPRIFWGEVAPREHLLQFYDDDVELLDALEGFVVDGLAAGEGVIVIASRAHREGLRDRIEPRGIVVDALIHKGRYLELDADETLSTFMVDGWPDEERFRGLLRHLLQRARGDGRPVRAFGEMVVTLWMQEDDAATVRLEQLWSALCEEEELAMLCAYPRVGLARGSPGAMNDILSAHSKLVAG